MDTKTGYPPAVGSRTVFGSDHCSTVCFSVMGVQGGEVELFAGKMVIV